MSLWTKNILKVSMLKGMLIFQKLGKGVCSYCKSILKGMFSIHLRNKLDFWNV